MKSWNSVTSINHLFKNSYYFLDKIKGLSNLWILGDNFTAKTFWKYFLSRPDVIEGEVFHEKSFIKEEFEFFPHCNSRYNSSIQNILIRLQNTFASAINKNISLPNYMLIVMDYDLIEAMDFQDPGMSGLMGEWLSWLTKALTLLIDACKHQLPVKAKKLDQPCVYWVLAPLHSGFSQKVNDCRKKINFCLESMLKGRSDMCVIKFKDKWDFYDRTLVNMDKITECGLYSYWEAVDAAFHFNVKCHELFLAKSKCAIKPENKITKITGSNDTSREDLRTQQKQNHNEVVSEDRCITSTSY